jgi:hypothetical protein
MCVLHIRPRSIFLSICGHSTFNEVGPTCQRNWRNSKIIVAAGVRTPDFGGSDPPINTTTAHIVSCRLCGPLWFYTEEKWHHSSRRKFWSMKYMHWPWPMGGTACLILLICTNMFFLNIQFSYVNAWEDIICCPLFLHLDLQIITIFVGP